MLLEHNSHEEFYRSPFGAAKTESTVSLRLSVSGGGIPHHIKCVIVPDKDEKYKIDMVYLFTVSGASIYGCTLNMPKVAQSLGYYFECVFDSGSVYYGNNEQYLGGMGEVYDKCPLPMFRITVYDKNYKTPGWFRKSVAYQIFPDRFFNGNEDMSFCGERSDIVKRAWGDMPFYKAEQFGGEYLSNDFFGGNLKGIEKKLGYLKKLGISVIYLNPIFKAYSNHRYDTGDYETIDSTLGTEEDFRSLCAEAEKNGIKIILDGVFNHTGSNSKYFNKNGEYDNIGAYQGEASPYYDWFRFGKTKDEYECWWGMKTLPHTEETSKSFQEYILSGENSIIKRWLRAGASGWRLDVVDELPGFFVKMLRENVKEVSGDAVIIGEVWEDASTKESYGEKREYFLGHELDSVMNYPLRNAIIDAIVQNIDAVEFSKRLMSLKENYPPQAFNACLNMLSSHDVERAVTLLSGVQKPKERDAQAAFVLRGAEYEKAKKRALLAAALQMTLPGVPCIYYGDEKAMQGFADPFCRQTFDWENNENEAFTNKFSEYIALRNSSDAFSGGEFTVLYALGNVFVFSRHTENEKYIIAVNFSDEYSKIRLDAGKLGYFGISNISHDENLTSPDGIYWVEIPGCDIKIFKA